MAAVTDDEREEELSTLAAIFPELVRDKCDPFSATLELPVTPSKPLIVRFLPPKRGPITNGNAAYMSGPSVEHDLELSHLPPLSLQIHLPPNYPADSPPKATLRTHHDWLPKEKLEELEQEAAKLWEEYGQCQILFAYIDHLQQSAESGFDLDQTAHGCLILESKEKNELVKFNADTILSTFRAGTFDCGICLEPKKGSSCHRMKRCGHVFCLQCLQDFYKNAITEGDIVSVRCLDPGCGKEHATPNPSARKTKRDQTLHPRELLEMGIHEDNVRRYLEMKRKKKLEADKTTVYCPRTWCQGPARSMKYPPIPADLNSFIANEDASDDEDAENENTSTGDRLAVCEKCSLAFCRVCYMGWHGQFARCYPRDPNELSAEEKASYDYIRQNTSPCPTCNSPTQKTMGCNHMKCFQCNSHFCYLCGSWLDGDSPYQHFNKAGTDCYQRLWELEEGDEGQNPGDGRGFGGGRGWEQIALEVARQADAEEAEAAALEAAQRAQEDEDARAAAQLAEADEAAPNGAREVGLENAMAQVRVNDQPPPPQAQQRAAQRGGAAGIGRRQRNPFPAHPPAANHNAQAIRNHERGAGRWNANGRRRGPHPPLVNDEDERQRQELQRFLEMARRDEEDGWDSDELGDEAGFEIR